jgi:hypothetical protein
MLQKEAVDKDTLALIKNLQSKEYLTDFILVGGTALAIHIGHRKSIDIDLFTTHDFDAQLILEKLENDFNFRLDFQDKNTLKGFIGDIKVDILSHKYDLINPPACIDVVNLASIEDITAMKLNAISRDGTRVKDFIDIYYLLKDYSIDDFLSFYEKKYSQRNSMHVLKSLNYFDDVSLEDWPVLVKDPNLSWKSIKKRINESVLAYTNSIIRNRSNN